MKEFIICSAIWCKVVGKFESQPLNISSGFVVTGRRHSDCYYTIISIGAMFEISSDATELVESTGRNCQGFLTSTNRFVYREEAFAIAKAAGQLQAPQLYNDINGTYLLTSEDLWWGNDTI